MNKIQMSVIGVLPISICCVIHPQTYDLKQKENLFIIHKNLFSKYILISKANSLILISVSSSGREGGWAYNPKDQNRLQVKTGPKPPSTLFSYLCTELKRLNFWPMAT